MKTLCFYDLTLLYGMPSSAYDHLALQAPLESVASNVVFLTCKCLAEFVLHQHSVLDAAHMQEGTVFGTDVNVGTCNVVGWAENKKQFLDSGMC